MVDGSTDNSVSILRKYENILLIVSEKDNGQADAIIKDLMQKEIYLHG
jgi:glycosyltransferase involved in cell wall biosynthesis